ncbi:MAG: hypothetical protein AABY22_02005 [Nanoarchaeota archaeon]
MENKTLIISSVSLVIIAALALTIFIINQKSLSPQQNQTILENCKTLLYNGENKVNLVFFSTKEQAEKYQKFFYTISPFDKNKEAFNFYYIDKFTPKCEIYKGIAILCYSKELIKKAASCPNDYIIAIKEESPNIRSSSYMNVMSINSQHKMSVLAHEFGHAFVTLAEEYTPATIPRGAKNCQSSCDNFNVNDGCFQECSTQSLYRSIENGVMRTLSSSKYGIFSENLILKKLNKNQKRITGSTTENTISCENEKYYLIEANYSNNDIQIINKYLQQGCLGTNGAGDFSYNLILNDNSIFTQEEFNPELIFTDSQSEEQEQIEGETYINEGLFILKIPAIENSKSLEIYKDTEKIEEINLQYFDFRACPI